MLSQHALQVVSQHALQQGGLLLRGACSGGVCGPPNKADGYCCGRYASYWNAFLLLVSVEITIGLLLDISVKQTIRSIYSVEMVTYLIFHNNFANIPITLINLNITQIIMQTPMN